MKNKRALLLFLLLSETFWLFTPKTALAFSCTSNGVQIGGSGTFTIPVDVTLSKLTNEIILTDMSTYTTCHGVVNTSYQDALKVTGTTLSSTLSGLGFSGFIVVGGSSYNFPATNQCIWPDGNCTVSTGVIETRLNVKIGMHRLDDGRWNSSTLPVGTEIARLSVLQRGLYARAYMAWGAPKTWIFTLRNPLVIPAYSCSVNNPNQTVNLPRVNKTDIQSNGIGKYPEATLFKINLTCDPQTTVSVKFDGAAMEGKDDVLANTSSGNDSIGVQMLFNEDPITLGQNMRVIENSQEQETLALEAYYYYNGGAVNAGEISSVTTFTFVYN